MKFLGQNKIRMKFLIPILSLQFFALGILGFIGYRFSSNALKSGIEEEFRNSVDSVYVAIESELDGRLARVWELIHDSDSDLEVFRAQNSGIFSYFERVGTDGVVMQRVNLNKYGDIHSIEKNEKESVRSNSEWFSAAISGKTFIGRPENIKGVSLIPIAIPHRTNNAIDGVFIVMTTTDFMKAALEKIETKSLLVILDDTGEAIAKRGDLNIFSRLPGGLILELHSVPEGKLADVGKYIIMHQTVPVSGWRIVMVGDSSALYSGIYGLRNKTFFIIVASLSLMAAFIFVIIKKLLNPILNLKKASEMIAGGELGVVIRRDSDDEIGSLTDSFNLMSTRTKEMHDELEEKNIKLSRINFVRRQLLCIISHELRTPMSSVVAFHDLIQEEIGGVTKLSPELVELFRNMGDGIAHCKTLVERLTRASSAITEQIRQDGEALESSDLDDALHTTCKIVEGAAAGRKISLDYPDKTGIEVACPLHLVNFMLEEVLSNAVKYSPDGETIIIGASVGDKLAKISILDKGPGIPKEYIDSVVEPFFEVQDANLHTSGRFAKMAGGLGLGLTIVVGVLRQYGGDLDIQSPKEGGTVVTMTIPLACKII